MPGTHKPFWVGGFQPYTGMMESSLSSFHGDVDEGRLRNLHKARNHKTFTTAQAREIRRRAQEQRFLGVERPIKRKSLGIPAESNISEKKVSTKNVKKSKTSKKITTKTGKKKPNSKKNMKISQKLIENADDQEIDESSVVIMPGVTAPESRNWQDLSQETNLPENEDVLEADSVGARSVEEKVDVVGTNGATQLDRDEEQRDAFSRKGDRLPGSGACIPAVVTEEEAEALEALTSAIRLITALPECPKYRVLANSLTRLDTWRRLPSSPPPTLASRIPYTIKSRKSRIDRSAGTDRPIRQVTCNPPGTFGKPIDITQSRPLMPAARSNWSVKQSRELAPTLSLDSPTISSGSFPLFEEIAIPVPSSHRVLSGKSQSHTTRNATRTTPVRFVPFSEYPVGESRRMDYLTVPPTDKPIKFVQPDNARKAAGGSREQSRLRAAKRSEKYANKQQNPEAMLDDRLNRQARRYSSASELNTIILGPGSIVQKEHIRANSSRRPSSILWAPSTSEMVSANEPEQEYQRRGSQVLHRFRRPSSILWAPSTSEMVSTKEPEQEYQRKGSQVLRSFSSSPRSPKEYSLRRKFRRRLSTLLVPPSFNENATERANEQSSQKMGPEGLQPAFNYLHKSGVEPRQMNFRRRMSTFVLPPIASESSEGRWNEQSDQIRNSKQTRHSNNASGGSKKDSPLEDFGRQPSTFLPPNVGNESSKGKWDGQKDHKRGLQRPHYSSSSSERDKNDSPLKNFGRRLSTLLLPNAGNESPDGKWDRQRDNRRGSQRPRYSSSSSERNKNDSPLKNFGRRLSTLLLPNAGNESSDGKWDGQRDNRRGSQRPRYSSSSSERDKNDSPLKNFGRRLSTLLLPNVGNDSSEGKRDGQRDHRRGSQRPRYSSSSSERSKIDSPLKNFGRRLSTLLLPSKPDEGSRDRRGSHYSSSPSKKSVEDSPLANFGRRLSTFLLPPMDSDRSDNFGYEKSKQRRASQWSSNKEARRKSSQGHRSSSSREDSKFSKSRRKSSIRSLMISPYVQSQIRYDPNSRSSFTDDKSNVAKRVGKFVKRIFVSKKDEHRYK